MSDSSAKRVAIVAALEREVRPLVKTWRITERDHDGRRFRFFENGEVVLVCGGIGSAAARRAAEAVITLFAPKIIYSAGFAGALDDKLTVGDVIRPRVVINASDGSRVTLEGGERTLVSFETVASPAQKAKLRDSFAAHAVDMEAASVARSAEARGIEFAAVKVISDTADFDLPSMERFVDSEGRFLETRFIWFTAFRPWLWLQVMRLAQNSSRASRSLCASLRAA